MKIWSGQEKLTDGWTDRRTDGGHDIIQPILNGRLKMSGLPLGFGIVIPWFVCLYMEITHKLF